MTVKSSALRGSLHNNRSHARGLPQHDGEDERDESRKQDEDIEERLLTACSGDAALHHPLVAAAQVASGTEAAANGTAAAARRQRVRPARATPRAHPTPKAAEGLQLGSSSTNCSSAPTSALLCCAGAGRTVGACGCTKASVAVARTQSTANT
eukprot:CAMPEP_0171095072 /NCGR_PEP_ID=MMETSP0766_2-20121228/42971_1 /TAXON_ID=439317 /ORGANISM="Gambierdiscus australes, Strain CAWD 149" /LENGTH=152 /DNA_ID=CAMNT_0011553841 /DNA_START=38 /DNA_END=497 /DNA_ORIENTATION=-